MLCRPIYCQTHISHGSVTWPCTRRHDHICRSFKCDPNHTKTHMPLTLTCRTSGTYYAYSKAHWEWDRIMGEPCVLKSYFCPSTFKNGKISGNCHLQDGAECSYSCDIGCEEIPAVSKIHCKHGRWIENTDNLCTNCRRCPEKIDNGLAAPDSRTPCVTSSVTTVAKKSTTF